jgi:hypothetical protein
VPFDSLTPPQAPASSANASTARETDVTERIGSTGSCSMKRPFARRTIARLTNAA